MDEEKALKFLLRKADEAEIYYAKGESNTVSVRGGEVEIFEGSSTAGYGIRVINKKRTGFAYSNTLEEKNLIKALEIARISEEDEYVSLPEQGKYPRVKGDFDEDIRSLEIEDALELAKTLIGPCEKYSVHPASGGITWSAFEVRVVNSKGVWGEEKGTVCSCYLNAVAKGKGVSTGMEYMSSRNLDLDFASIGDAASKLAKESLGAKKIGGMMARVVLKPNAVAELLESVLVPSFSADNVQRGRSYLGNKLDKKVFSNFDVIDYGTKPQGLNTSKFDSEGMASQRTVLVKGGVLKGFLYDTYSANKASIESTGNAMRGSYSSLPYIDTTNLVLSGPGGIEGEGFVVNGLIGAHTSNPVSGDFSLETRNAFYQSKPVKKALIAGNIYELFEDINGFGGEENQVGGVVTPSIEFSNVKIVG